MILLKYPLKLKYKYWFLNPIECCSKCACFTIFLGAATVACLVTLFTIYCLALKLGIKIFASLRIVAIVLAAVVMVWPPLGNNSGLVTVLTPVRKCLAGRLICSLHHKCISCASSVCLDP